jgi:hypothetical protein
MKYILITLILFVSSCATTKKPPVGDFLPLAQSYANIGGVKGFNSNNVACPDECKW